MKDNCPRCEADVDMFFKFWRKNIFLCGSRIDKKGFFYQSDKCSQRITEKRLRDVESLKLLILAEATKRGWHEVHPETPEQFLLSRLTNFEKRFAELEESSKKYGWKPAIKPEEFLLTTLDYAMNQLSRIAQIIA